MVKGYWLAVIGYCFNDAKVRKKWVVCKQPPTSVRSEKEQLITTPYQADTAPY